MFKVNGTTVDQPKIWNILLIETSKTFVNIIHFVTEGVYVIDEWHQNLLIYPRWKYHLYINVKPKEDHGDWRDQTLDMMSCSFVRWVLQCLQL